LSPTHIHEFKSADRIYTQPPVMSLYLPDQKLGSRSQPGSSSHKFVVKGRQAGSMHRGHTWVFRAESYETMLAWYDDIKSLTEKTGEERNAFVRRHASVRSASAGSTRSSSDFGLEEDEADAVPYSANQSIVNQAVTVRETPTRPSPGGRFPSDLNVKRDLRPLSPSSGSSDIGNDLTTAAGGPPQDIAPVFHADNTYPQSLRSVQTVQQQQAYPATDYVNTYPPTQQPLNTAPEQYISAFAPQVSDATQYAQPVPQTYQSQVAHANLQQNAQQFQNQPGNVGPAPVERHTSSYGNWMAPAAGGVAAGALASEAYRRQQMEQQERAQQQEINEFQKQEHHLERQSTTASTIGAIPAIPERDPGHHSPTTNPESMTFTPLVSQPQTISDPIVFAGTPYKPSQRGNVDGAAASPSIADSSFLDDSEVGSAVPALGKTINGGPVPVELVEVAEAQAHPGMMRTNTDMSVSDLHVPGEYPRGAKMPLR
jgi:hypothetical protein